MSARTTGGTHKTFLLINLEQRKMAFIVFFLTYKYSLHDFYRVC